MKPFRNAGQSRPQGWRAVPLKHPASNYVNTIDDRMEAAGESSKSTSVAIRSWSSSLPPIHLRGKPGIATSLGRSGNTGRQSIFRLLLQSFRPEFSAPSERIVRDFRGDWL